MGVENWAPKKSRFLGCDDDYFEFFYVKLPRVATYEDEDGVEVEREATELDDEIAIESMDAAIRWVFGDKRTECVPTHHMETFDHDFMTDMFGGGGTLISEVRDLQAWRIGWEGYIVIVLVSKKIYQLLHMWAETGEDIGKRHKRACDKLGCELDRVERHIMMKLERMGFSSAWRTSAWTSHQYRHDPHLPVVPKAYGGRKIWSSSHREIQFGNVEKWLAGLLQHEGIFTKEISEGVVTTHTLDNTVIATTRFTPGEVGGERVIELHI